MFKNYHCQHCDNRHPVSEKRPPWRWICIKFPRQPMADEIDWDEDERHGTWDGFDPYHPCERVQQLFNFNCPHFTVKRELEKENEG